MRPTLITPPVLALALAALYWPAAACQTNPAAVKEDRTAQAQAGATAQGQGGAAPNSPADPFEKIPRMKAEEVAEAVRQGRAVVVDVRPPEAFAEEHIRGALSLPEEDAVERGGELPKDKLVVTYCA